MNWVPITEPPEKSQYVQRGKRLNGCGWIYGSLLQNEDMSVIVVEFEESAYCGIGDCPYTHGVIGFEVDPETVGQYTGKKDDYNTEICHGDIIDFEFIGFNGDFYSEMRRGVVKWSEEDCAFVIADNLENVYYDDGDLILFGDAWRASGDTKVVGNMYDNPELLEVEP